MLFRTWNVFVLTPNASSTIARDVGPQLEDWNSVPSNCDRIGTSSSSRVPTTLPLTASLAGSKVGS